MNKEIVAPAVEIKPVLSDEQIQQALQCLSAEASVEGDTVFLKNINGCVRAIERAVLQSPEVQQMRKDAERYRWLKQRMIAVDFEYGDPPCIALVFSMPGRGMVFAAGCDANVDLGMAQAHTE